MINHVPKYGARLTERLVSAISNDNGDTEVHDFLTSELDQPKYRFNPTEADLAAEPLAATWNYWRRFEFDGGVAQASRVEPEALIPALGYLMILDVIDFGADFEYALYGSNVARFSGFDMTGKRIGDIPTTNAVQTYFLACYRAVLTLKQPLFSKHRAPENIMIGYWLRLILPMGEGQDVKRLLVCNVPTSLTGDVR